MSEVALRTAGSADEEFLYNLLKATMQEYVAQTWGWDEQSQEERFRDEFEPGMDRIIVLEGKDIGVISTEQKDEAIFLDKIYILPEYQGRGIGTYLIRSVLDEAFRSGLPVTLRVLKVNPVRKLYERLGFVETGETDTQYLMKATPQKPGQ
jgi:GNAT superfamily N-acetyltransferase